MSKKYSSPENVGFVVTIRKLRNRAGLSQQDVADAVGIARATYVKLENGGREPKQSEILALAQYYEVSPLTIMTGEHLVEEPRPVYSRTSASQVPKAHTSHKQPEQLKPEKLRAVLLYVATKIGADPNIGESSIYGLLYHIDTEYATTHGHSITGLTYTHSHYGPKPDATFLGFAAHMVETGELDIISTKHFNNTRKKYIPVTIPDLDALTAAELDHIIQLLARYPHHAAWSA